MDRQAWIAVTLCVIGLVAWQFYMTSHPPPRPVPAAVTTATASPAATVAAASPPAAAQSPETSLAPVQPPVEAVAEFEERTEVLRNPDMELRLTNRGGGISEVVLLNHKAETAGPVVLNTPKDLPIGSLISQPAQPLLPEFQGSPQGDGSFVYERKTPAQLTIRKRFSFPPSEAKKDSFVAQMEVDFRNEGAGAYVDPGYFIALGSARPGHQKDSPTYTRVTWSIEGKPDHTDVSWFEAQKYPIVGVEKRAAQPIFERAFGKADWAAISNQFFVTLLTPQNASATDIWARRIDLPAEPNRAAVHGIEGAMRMPGFTLPPGQTHTLSVQIYAGPKLYNRLAQLKKDEAAIMDFGIFKLFSQALLNLMNLLHGWVGNYAVAILLLTCIVKGVLWPLQNKANSSMRRMAALSPKMQELREKYKDDPTKMNQELMKLYKEYGVNPVAGCLPMMIQLPIFFGLFTMLQQAVELRNAGFLWVDDLSQPDTVGYLPALGWPVNILPLVMAATNVWMFQITPKTGDKTQQRVMMFMPLIFVIFCYNFAAALSLYYTVQNLLTILQLYQNRNQPLPVLEKAKAAPAGKKQRKGSR